MKALKVWQDNDAEDPRSWDNLGTMVCWHKKYNLGDRHDYQMPGEFMCWVKEIGLGDIVMLPVYLYDHSGITISTAPFSCPWDSGQVGWIYVTKDRLRREFGLKRISKRIFSKAEEILRAEVETYDQYLRGDIYGFTVYDTAHPSWGPESCGGFFGDDLLKNGIKSFVPEFGLSETLLWDGLIITDSGEVFDLRNDYNEIIKEIFPDDAEKYFVIRSLML